MVKSGLDIEEMRTVLNFLANDGQVPESYKPHVLSGKFKGIWECHINPDWLLIYKYVDDKLVLLLYALGSHSELFN